MGVSLCSQACTCTKTINEFQYTEELRTSEEWEDSDTEDSNIGRERRSVTMPAELRQIFDDSAKMRRKAKSANETRSSKCSMDMYTKDWQCSSEVNREGELQAERYSQVLTDDSLKHLRHTIRTAGSIVDKGSAINDELARQDRVIFSAENDITITEYETEQTIEKLKGMASLGGKLASMVWKKKPKLRISELSKERSFSNVNLNLLDGDVGLCAFSKMGSSKATRLSTDILEDMASKQAQLREGIGLLNKKLDAITVQQMDTAWALGEDDGRLSVFEKRMSTTQRKINCQTQMINSIIGK